MFLTDRFHHDYISIGRPNNTYFNRLVLVDRFAPDLVTPYNFDDPRVAGVIESDVLSLGCLQSKRSSGRCDGAIHDLVLSLVLVVVDV